MGRERDVETERRQSLGDRQRSRDRERGREKGQRGNRLTNSQTKEEIALKDLK